MLSSFYFLLCLTFILKFFNIKVLWTFLPQSFPDLPPFLSPLGTVAQWFNTWAFVSESPRCKDAHLNPPSSQPHHREVTHLLCEMGLTTGLLSKVVTPWDGGQYGWYIVTNVSFNLCPPESLLNLALSFASIMNDLPSCSSNLKFPLSDELFALLPNCSLAYAHILQNHSRGISLLLCQRTLS